jgi:hypothetical protein
MITKEKLIAAGTEKLADILLSLYESNKDIKKQLNVIFAGLDEDPKKIISIIKKEISALKKSTKFVDYYESDNLAERINQLRINIANDLLLKSPNHARELMLEFFNLHKATLNRCDDSNGTISDVFRIACEDLGKICEQISAPDEELVNLVFTKFMNNEYGIYDKIISNFNNALKDSGLELLKAKIEEASNQKNISKIKSGLQEIADCKKDVDAYIKACSFKGDPSDHDYLDIAKRLIEIWRAKEALQCLDKIDIPSNHFWQEDCRKLKIQAFELDGDYEKAQNERIAWFENNLSPDLYGQILKHAKMEFKEPFRKEAINKAFHFQETHTALAFLTQIQEFEEAGNLVKHKINELHGRQYYILRPIAGILCDIDPLAATLLYRKMIEPILEEAKSKYYSYGAKDLVMCNILSLKITNWQSCQNHYEYFKILEEKNKRKFSFWNEYKIALQKKSKKETKKIASD